MSFSTNKVSLKLQQVLRYPEHQMGEALEKDQELRNELVSNLAQASIPELSEWARNHKLLTAVLGTYDKRIAAVAGSILENESFRDAENLQHLLNSLAVMALDASLSEEGMEHVISLALNKTVSTDSPTEQVEALISSLSTVSTLCDRSKSTSEIPIDQLNTGNMTRYINRSIIGKTAPIDPLSLLYDYQEMKRIGDSLDPVIQKMAQQNWPPAFTALLTSLRDEVLKYCKTGYSSLMSLLQNTESETYDVLVRMIGMVRLLNTLCEQLDTAVPWLSSQDVTADTARKQYMERAKILRFVQMVEENIEKIKGAASFSVQGLDVITQLLHADMDAIMSKAKAGARPVTFEIPFDQLSTAQDIASAVKNLFGDQSLRSAVKRELAKAGSDETKLMGLLRDFVHLADEAIHAPDYAETQNGWFHPVSRTGYRNRSHDPFTLWSSAARQEASKEKLGQRLLAAINSEQPVDAMGRLITNSFIEEIGLDTVSVQDWTVEMTAVQEAIRANLLLPLRALNETKQNLNKGEKELDPIIHKVVTEITKAVLEGRFREWRYENSKHQLSGLSGKQLEIWKSGASAELWGLKTREEDDLGLFWVTKVGGPSHGFDRNGNCLLPLLCNSRTKAIMIDDLRYPDAPAARSYLRLVHREDGSPELFLEPFQRDFPHREIIGDAPEVNDVYYAEIIIHAVKKAEQMGLPLTINEHYGEIAKALHFRFKPRETELLLKASSGIFEASDTLSSKHDWVQMKDELTEPLYRLVFYPGQS